MPTVVSETAELARHLHLPDDAIMLQQDENRRCRFAARELKGLPAAKSFSSGRDKLYRAGRAEFPPVYATGVSVPFSGQ